MPTGSSNRSGPPPKPPDKRRRVQTPASYGLAEPIKAGNAGEQPELGFEAHQMVQDLWRALNGSVEARFFSVADWERARLEMLFIHATITNPKGISPTHWQRVQSGLSELLVSPADKRRSGIELKPVASDPDEDAAVDMLAGYREKLTG